MPTGNLCRRGLAHRQPVKPHRPLGPDIRHGGQSQARSITAGKENRMKQVQVHENPAGGIAERQRLDMQGRAVQGLMTSVTQGIH